MNGLHEAFDEVAAEARVYGDLDRAFEQADRERRQRFGVVAGLAAAAAVLVVIVGALAVTRGDDDSPQPIGPSTPTVTTTDAEPTAEAQIQGWEDYLATTGARCDGCHPVAFDPDSGTLLTGTTANGHYATLRVFGPDGQLAALSCPDVACGDGFRAMNLGPNTDEVSILTVDPAAALVSVVSYDGTLRRTIDLSAVSPDFYDFQRLAWAPDGSRLALTTFDAKIWLVSRDGGEPHLVHSPGRSEGLTASGRYLETLGWGTAWSPDGSRLGLIEAHELSKEGRHTRLSMHVFSVRLTGPGQDGPGEATTLYDGSDVDLVTGTSRRKGYLSNLLWSPDGARVAITDGGHLIELAADGGGILARQPSIESTYLVWPAAQP